MARPRIDPSEIDARLIAAAAAIEDRGEKLTGTRLRAEAAVSSADAHDWLRANRPTVVVQEIPEDFAKPLNTFWTLAYQRIESEVRASFEGQISAHDMELQDAEDKTTTANAETAAALQRVAELEMELAAVQTQFDEASNAAANALEKAHAAELRAVRAEANAETNAENLRDVVREFSRERMKARVAAQTAAVQVQTDVANNEPSQTE